MSIYFSKKLKMCSFIPPCLSIGEPPHPQEYIRPPLIFVHTPFPKNSSKHFSTPAPPWYKTASVEKKSPSSMEATELFESSDRFEVQTPKPPSPWNVFFWIPTKGYAAMLCLTLNGLEVRQTEGVLKNRGGSKLAWTEFHNIFQYFPYTRVDAEGATKHLYKSTCEGGFWYTFESDFWYLVMEIYIRHLQDFHLSAVKLRCLYRFFSYGIRERWKIGVQTSPRMTLRILRQKEDPNLKHHLQQPRGYWKVLSHPKKYILNCYIVLIHGTTWEVNERVKESLDPVMKLDMMKVWSTKSTWKYGFKVVTFWEAGCYLFVLQMFFHL